MFKSNAAPERERPARGGRGGNQGPGGSESARPVGTKCFLSEAARSRERWEVQHRDELYAIFGCLLKVLILCNTMHAYLGMLLLED